MVDPAAVGVPEITPDELRLKPAGRVPELTDQLYGGVPPVAARVTLYAELTTPTVSGEVVVIVRVVGGVVPPPLPPPQPTKKSAETKTAQRTPDLPIRITGPLARCRA